MSERQMDGVGDIPSDMREYRRQQVEDMLPSIDGRRRTIAETDTSSVLAQVSPGVGARFEGGIDGQDLIDLIGAGRTEIPEGSPLSPTGRVTNTTPNEQRLPASDRGRQAAASRVQALTSADLADIEQRLMAGSEVVGVDAGGRDSTETQVRDIQASDFTTGLTATAAAAQRLGRGFDLASGQANDFVRLAAGLPSMAETEQDEPEALPVITLRAKDAGRITFGEPHESHHPYPAYEVRQGTDGKPVRVPIGKLRKYAYGAGEGLVLCDGQALVYVHRNKDDGWYRYRAVQEPGYSRRVPVQEYRLHQSLLDALCMHFDPAYGCPARIIAVIERDDGSEMAMYLAGDMQPVTLPDTRLKLRPRIQLGGLTDGEGS